MLTTVGKSLTDMGYREHLIKHNYSYASFGEGEAMARQVMVAAFAQEPPSALTACIGITSDQTQLHNLHFLGAPVIVEMQNGTGRWWQSKADGLAPLDRSFIPLPQLFQDHKEDWKPDRIFRAKSIGAFEKSAQLDFVDLGLLPAIESEARQKLDELIRMVVARASDAYRETHQGQDPPETLLFRLLFKLITAKVLRDTGVATDLDFSHPRSVLQSVQKYNPSDRLIGLDDAMLVEASSQIAASFPFSNISADTLAFVYENTLVTEATRKKLSIHPTPSYVAEYMLGRLPLADLELDCIRIADPMCGQGTFLVAALKRLRTLLPNDWSPEERHNFFLQHLVGQDIDPFSVEVARLSLTLADLPHPNGWKVKQADTYAAGVLEKIASDTTVFLTNPPFEAFTKEEIAENLEMQTTKAAEMLVRVLRSLPNNALVGVVMPLSFLTGRRYREARELLASSYVIHELLTLPDNVFGRSDTESALLLAKKRSHDVARSYPITYRAVGKDALDDFEHTGAVSRDEPIESSEVLDEGKLLSTGFWVPSLHSIWSSLAHNRKLSDIARVHRGVEYQSKLMKEHRDLLVRERQFPDSALGVDVIEDQLRPFAIAHARWLSTQQAHRRRHAWEFPWSEPKVLVNAARQSVGPWRMIAAVDSSGLLATQRFHAIWLDDNALLPFVVALLNSALANAFVTDHEGGRSNHGRTIKSLPLPNEEHPALKAVTELSAECHRRMAEDLDSDLTNLLLEIDAQLLHAYGLPPRDEKRLLDLFSDAERPSCPSFTGFYPSGFTPAVPLRIYLSEEFRQASANKILASLPSFDDPVITDMLRDLREAS